MFKHYFRQNQTFCQNSSGRNRIRAVYIILKTNLTVIHIKLKVAGGKSMV